MTEAATLNLFQQQQANRRRTRWLVVGFVLFFAWLGFGGDYVLYLATRDARPQDYHHVFPWLGIVLTLIAAGLARYAYVTGPDKVLWATGAWELIDPVDDKQKMLVNVVEEMAIAAGVPRPRIWLVQDPDPNAFATGTDPAHAHVAVTQGLLDICNRDELQGVIGHELGHVKNLDVRLMTTLTALVGAVLLIRDGTGRMLWGGARLGGVGGRGGGGGGGGGGGRGGDRDEGRGLGQLAILLIVVWVISWILAPIVTQLLVLAVSRKREYLADAMGAQFTRNPLALASALEKIESAEAPTLSIKGGAAHLCIADPVGHRFTTHEGFIGDALSTHPPMGMRIARLKGMGYAQLKRESGTGGTEPST